MADDLESVLNRSPLTKAQKADAWDAFNASSDEDDLASRLEALSIPKQAKASLWDLKAASAPEQDFSDVEAGSSAIPTDRSGASPNPEDQIANITPGMGYFDAAGELERAKDAQWSQNVGASAAGAATGLAMVVPAMAPARLGGAIMGGQEGYRRGGLPGAAVGAVTGAVAPGATFAGTGASAVAELAGGGAAGGIVAGVAGLALRRYGLGGAAKKFAGMFGGDAKAAATALEKAAKAAPAAEKLRIAKLPAAQVEAELAQVVPPRPSGADVQAMIPGTRFTAEETAGMVARARAVEAAAAAKRGVRAAPPAQAATAPSTAPGMAQEATTAARTAPMPTPAVAAPTGALEAKAAEALDTVTKLRERGFGRSEMIKALKNGPLEDLTPAEIGSLVDKLQKGHVVLPSPRGGAGRLTRTKDVEGAMTDEELMSALQQSVK
jgi:hypothetical protein